VVVAAPESVDPEELWRDLSAVGIANSDRVDSQGRQNMETRYYILGRLITVREFTGAGTAISKVFGVISGFRSTWTCLLTAPGWDSAAKAIRSTRPRASGGSRPSSRTAGGTHTSCSDFGLRELVACWQQLSAGVRERIVRITILDHPDSRFRTRDSTIAPLAPCGVHHR
jgi:hypothetical protein